MTEQRTYPAGVPCWVDLETADPDAATAFYGGLLGWEFREAMPEDAPGSYRVANLHGRPVGAIASGAAVLGEIGAWNTYIAVDDADATAAAIQQAGGTIMAPPTTDPGGRAAVAADPQGAEFRLWQAGARAGSQAVNTPGGWGFSDLRSPDLAAARAFYSAVFPWTYTGFGDDVDFVLVRGYGAHLAATADPDIHVRQDAVRAPEWFADVAARMQPAESGEDPHWRVSFGVPDADAAAEAVERLGGRVWARGRNAFQILVDAADPEGAHFTLSQYAPPR